MRFTLLIMLSILVRVQLLAQLRTNEVEVLSEVVPFDDPQLQRTFSSFQTLHFNPKALHSAVSDPSFNNEISWKMGEETIRFALYEHDIRHVDYQLQVQTDAGIQTLPRTPNTTYRGWNLDTGEGEIRLSITASRVSGFVTNARGEEIYIQPVSDFGSLASPMSVLYRAEDVISDPNKVCGSTHRHDRSEVNTLQPPNHGRSMACEEAEVAIAADKSMYTKFGNNAIAVESELIGIKNLMEPNYAAFNLEFKVKTVYVVSGTDPWTSSADPGALLDDFCCWAGSGSSNQLNCTGGNGFQITHDVGELWTNRDFSGSTIGVAWIGTICDGMFKYSVDQHFTSNQQQLRVLIAHECGHNFGSDHDASGSSFIMAPSVNGNAVAFSSASQSAINTELPGFTCLGNCTPDCPDPAVQMELVSLTPGGCGSSTYNLTLVINHGGGNGSGFNVNIAGVNYFRSFNSSPQTVVVSGLASTGASSIPVTIRAVTSASTHCDDAGAYDAPQAECAALDEQVDFDNCQLPVGWSHSSTNPYTFRINGVEDPEWQYEWKFDNANRPFANYNQGANANSSLTIDGTCMAYFDDDLTNIVEYTGINTLTTSSYNLNGFDQVSLAFDYNFHNFEEAGKSNNESMFMVEVYDGTNWVQVLYDDQDQCPYSDVWSSGCTTHANIDVDAYRNANFQVRFIYSDGNTSSWTGMIALDNFHLQGYVINTGPCDETLTITPSEPNGFFQASNSIFTSGNIVVSSSAKYDAPENVLNSGFEVSSGAVF